MPDVNLLVVPVVVDALCLATDLGVVGPSADFSRLPYVDPANGRDVGADVPYLSEVVLPTPFEDQGTPLRAGVHLHWALPDALTRLVHTQAGVEIPAVPNRWLVTRTRGGVVDRQWVVDSDVLSDVDSGAVTYPMTGAEPAGATGRPYRFLGRRVPLAAWDPTADRSDRLPVLTAVGYGEPTFAAFYPNCHSVFGLPDVDVIGTPPAGLGYDVLGWYDDPGADELARVLAAATGDWSATLAERLGWAAPASAPPPVRLACFGQLVFDPEPPTDTPDDDGDSAGVWVGNTATEALAAHLGAAVAGTSPDELENLLEALAYADELESATVDLPERLAEARHAASLADLPGGTRWTVRRQDDPAGATAVTPAEKQARERLAVPAQLGPALGELNELQRRYDRAVAELAGQRGRLATDWYRYQLCAYRPDGTRDSYPDPDEVAEYLRRGIDAVSELAAIVGDGSATPAADSLAGRLAGARAAVAEVLARTNVAAAAARSSFVLQAVPAPAYHRPTEPVVLLTGSAARPSDRYGQDGADAADGLLGCAVVTADADATTTRDGVAALRDQVADLAGTEPVLVAARRIWRRPPWQPVLLHWEVEFFPTSAGDNLDPANRNYAPDFVAANYELPAGDVELRLRPGHEVPDKAANVYTGSTVLSAASWPVLSDRVLRYLAGSLLAEYNAAAASPVAPAEFTAAPQPVLDWYDTNGTDPRLRTLVAVSRHLAANENRNLAQSLGGMNDALLMLRLTRQLPVADPLGFPRGRALAAEVATAVAGEHRHAPQPLTDFNPIRAGALRVRRLRIIDNFGVPHDVDTTELHTTTGLRVPEHSDWVALPPRLAQAARLTLELLDADDDLRPVTGSPSSSPICGWLLPDFLDDSLRVYAADGSWLGSLRGDAAPDDPVVWRPVPGAAPVTVAEIGNARLRTLVGWLAGAGSGRVGDFLDTLTDALAGIEPEVAALPTARTVLFGRPIAVVRAAVGLELAGPPAIHQDWNVFRQDLTRGGRETNDFPEVRFPVRMAEHGRLGDGVLGFWLEDPAGSLGATFHSAPELAGSAADSPVVVAADRPPVHLTLLVDPHATVRATSGVLPARTVTIVADHYQDAVAALEVGFLAAPVLTDADRVAVPVPAEPGAAWAWRELSRAGWSQSPVETPADDARFPTVPTMREGWLVLRPDPAADQTPEGS